MRLFCYFNFERNYNVLRSKSPCILMNKNINFSKNETESKMEYPTHSFRETLCFSSYKNRKLKVNLWWVGARQRKKRTCLFCPKEIFLTFVFYLNLYSVLNTLSEYTYFYISKNITSYTSVTCIEIVESRKCILNVYQIWTIYKII